MTDESGRYELRGLLRDPYMITAELSGFVPEERTQVEIPEGKIVRLDFSLFVGAIVAMSRSHVVTLNVAWRNADAVVYLRIDASLGAKLWGSLATRDTGLLATEHEASALAILKSHEEWRLDAGTFRFLQEGAGRWRDIIGEQDKPYRPGDTYVAFLKWDAALKHFIRYAGADAMVKVENGRVSLPKTDIPGTENGMSVEQFAAKLRALDGGRK
jgi:hypothetical protein